MRADRADAADVSGIPMGLPGETSAVEAREQGLCNCRMRAATGAAENLGRAALRAVPVEGLNVQQPTPLAPGEFTFSIKGLIVNIFSFLGHTISVATTQLCG